MRKLATANTLPKNPNHTLGCGALLVAAHVAFSVVGCSSAGASSDATSKEQALDRFIEDVTASMGMPGVQTAVVKDGKLVWAKSYGLAVTTPLPDRAMTNDTILELASISKELVAVAFMQQVEAGVLGLDDDISAALPWPVQNPHFPEVPITWRMVLSHTATIQDDPRAFDGFVLGADSSIPLGDLMRDLYTPTGRYYSEETFLAARPGTIYQYSTTAISLAAYAIELAVKQPFYEYVRDRIVEPLGMESTSYFLRDLPSDQLAVGYTCVAHGVGFACPPPGDPKGTVLDQQHAVPQYPVLLLRTTATQYSKFMAMLLNRGQVGGTSIISQASIEQLLAPLPITTDDGKQQGLVFFGIPESVDPGGDTMWGHGGADLGVAASAFFDRSSGVGAIAVGNSQSSAYTSTGQITRIVAKLLSEFR
jgi:CubicO group peptidase (beta-lactamase class C family)